MRINSHRGWTWAVRGAAALGVIALALSLAAQTRVKDGQLKFDLPDLEGKTVTHKDERFKDKVVLVDVFGTWCPPCREQIPFLVRLNDKYRDKGLEIVGIAFEKSGSDDEKVAGLKKFVEENKIAYTILFGGSTAAVRAKLKELEPFQGFPTTVFIDRKGRARRVEIGFSSSAEDEMEKLVVKLLEETP